MCPGMRRDLLRDVTACGLGSCAICKGRVSECPDYVAICKERVALWPGLRCQAQWACRREARTAAPGMRRHLQIIGESTLDDFSAQVLTHNTFTYYSTVE
jgi:hypothetical protein